MLRHTMTGGCSALCLWMVLVLVAPGVWAEGPRQVVANLDGTAIYRDEIEPTVALQVFKLRLEMHRLLEREIRALADRRLLAREASRAGVTVDELLARRIGTVTVSDREVEVYLRGQPGADSGNAGRERIRVYLAERQRIERKLEWLQTLRERAEFELHLDPPLVPRVEVDVDGAPVRGPSEAPVVIVHFSDLHSPRGTIGAGYIERLAEEFPGRLRQVHRPWLASGDALGLEIHEWAVTAQAQGLFWDFHDRLVALGGRVTSDALREIVTDLTLSREPPTDGRAIQPGPGVLTQVRDQLGVAQRVGLEHGAALFVNGRYFSATFPFAELERLVRDELQKTAGGS